MKHHRLPVKATLIFLLAALCAPVLFAHDGVQASVHDTVAAVIKRMQRELSVDDLVGVTVPKAEAFLTAEEREILGTGHIRFRVNVPVVITILRDASLGDEPFWLRERGYTATGLKTKFHTREFDAWEKSFPPGRIGLGVHNLSGRGTHYLVLVKPQQTGDRVQVSELYPGNLRTAAFVTGVKPFVDQELQLSGIPPALEGQLLIQADTKREEDAQLVNLFSKTPYPAPDRPDHVALTWSDDPRTTQTIQWRTSSGIKSGIVRYQVKPADGMFDARSARTKRANTQALSTPTLVNDPLNQRHTVVLTRLKPDTTYLYSVGDGSPDGWTASAEFTTAPARIVPFSFVYMGDAQNGLDRWGVLLQNAYRTRPDAAFYLMAGDLVNRGAERWDWDSFFEYSKGVFDRRQLVPALGNHEYQGGDPALYHAHFTLPRNGPKGIPPERAYSFEYSNAKFVILDSNQDAAKQTAWLERELASTKAVWKFVSYHHPAYSSSANRTNIGVRNLWTPIFDKYRVDLALQGHDHAYLRTYPMRAQERVANASDGTIYIVSVSGTKYYDQPKHDYTEVGFTKLSTYQVLDIQINGNRLVYRAHDVDGNVRDEFVIEK